MSDCVIDAIQRHLKLGLAAVGASSGQKQGHPLLGQIVLHIFLSV
jgi:hypothetical protein